MIRVGVIHDQTVFRIGLELLIDEQPDMRAVPGAATSSIALESLDVAVLGGVYGAPANIRGVLERARRDDAPAVVALVDGVDADKVEERLRAGAKGVIGCQASLVSLTVAIRSVAEGGIWRDPRLQSIEKERPLGWTDLTPRERQVAGLIAQGRRYEQIAASLGISGHTVRNHSRRIFDKMDVCNRVELAAALADSIRRR